MPNHVALKRSPMVGDLVVLSESRATWLCVSLPARETGHYYVFVTHVADAYAKLEGTEGFISPRYRGTFPRPLYYAWRRSEDIERFANLGEILEFKKALPKMNIPNNFVKRWN